MDASLGNMRPCWRVLVSTGMGQVTDTVSPSIAVSLAEVRGELVGFVARRVESREAAEDIVQDVLERAHRADLAAVDNPHAWLYRAARNAVIDHYRTRRADEPLAPELVSDLGPEESSDDDYAPNAATQELARCMRPLVHRLPATYRRAVTLVDLEGRTHAEAARVEQVSVSGMKSRVQRGRSRLGALLGECCKVATTPAGAVSSYARRNPDCC